MPVRTCALHTGVNWTHLSGFLCHFPFFFVFLFVPLLSSRHIYGCCCAHAHYKQGTIPSPLFIHFSFFSFFFFLFPFFSLEVCSPTDATAHMCTTNGKESNHLHFFLRFFSHLLSHTHLPMHLHTLSQRLFPPCSLPFFKTKYTSTMPLRTSALQTGDHLIATISFCLNFYFFCIYSHCAHVPYKRETI